MDLLNVYTRVGILFRTWYRRIAMYIHAAYKLKTTNLQLQDASYTNKQKNSVLWKSNEDMNLDQYLKTPAGQNQLKQAKNTIRGNADSRTNAKVSRPKKPRKHSTENAVESSATRNDIRTTKKKKKKLFQTR
jgi:hypothetical protein